MGYSSTLLCLSTFTISLSFLALSSFTTADDAAVMYKLLAALNGVPRGWSNSTDPCTWENVYCDVNSRVTSINLPSKSLSGTLPSNLGSLTDLTYLYLQENSLSGPLPPLANLSSLQELYLDNNNFSSIPDGFFQGLTSLKILTLSKNTNLAPWTFPTELTQATSLFTFNASSSNVAGSLPDIFDSFPSLNELWLSHNNLTGPIPDLSKCINLFDLQLRDNQFTGLVPDSLMSLPSLKNISLDNNELQGPFPAFPSSVTTVTNNGTNSYCKTTSGPCDSQVTILLEVAAALGYPIKLAISWQGNDACVSWSFIACNSQKMITSVNFSKQGFMGTISPAIASLTSLRTLYLNDNNLTSSIPHSLATLPDLQLLDVSNNNLTGPIPEFTSTLKFKATGNPLLGKTPGMIATGIVTLFAVIGIVVFVTFCFRRKFL